MGMADHALHAAKSVESYADSIRNLGNALRAARAKAQAADLADAIRRGQAPELLDLLRKLLQ